MRDETRERIVATAAELLARGGREAVTTRAVATAAGVQPPTIYRLFGDKVGLLDAVAEHGFQAYLADKGAGPSADPVEDLRAGWDLHVGFGLANPGLYALMYGDPRPGAASLRRRARRRCCARSSGGSPRSAGSASPRSRPCTRPRRGVRPVLTLLATAGGARPGGVRAGPRGRARRRHRRRARGRGAGPGRGRRRAAGRLGRHRRRHEPGSAGCWRSGWTASRRPEPVTAVSEIATRRVGNRDSP